MFVREATNVCGLNSKWCQIVKGARCEMGELREMEDRFNVFSIAWKDILKGKVFLNKHSKLCPSCSMPFK